MWYKPHLFILDGNKTIRVSSSSFTRIEHHKIEPKAKHVCHCKKNQSSWPNQIDSSKRLPKISNHAYKNSEKNQILFIDNQVHKPTIHRILANTLQKLLHRIDLQEDQGELCIEIQRERRSHLANNYGPRRSEVNYSHIIGEAMVLM